jgi:hypothetical protein
MSDTYKQRMDAINRLVDEQEEEERARAGRSSLGNWSEAFTNISNSAHAPLKTASHIMAGSQPFSMPKQKNIAGPAMERLNADSAQDILSRFKAADAKARLLQDYEAAKRKKELEDARLVIERAKANQKPSDSKSFYMGPEDRAYWKSRGLTDQQINMVTSGQGGRNPANTLNNMAERDELSSQQINTLKDFDESELVLNKMVEALGDNSEWTGPMDGRIPDVLVGADQVAWRSMVGRFNDLYRKAITGAGASALEIKRLETRLPQPNDTYANFKAKASQMLEELRDKKAMYIDGLEKGGQYVGNFKGSQPSENIAFPKSRPSGTAYADDGAADDYDNMSDDELERLLKERGLQ